MKALYRELSVSGLCLGVGWVCRNSQYLVFIAIFLPIVILLNIRKYLIHAAIHLHSNGKRSRLPNFVDKYLHIFKCQGATTRAVLFTV